MPLPRYESMGVQYADLPRVSTAAQEAAAVGFSQIGQSLDRMTNFFLGQAEQEAKRAGIKYAAENPLTKEQVDTALSEGKDLKVAGGGRIFQESYESTQASMLASELQAEGQTQIAKTIAAINAGADVDVNVVRQQLKDMTDGYTATVMALDPAQAVRLKAALTTAGNSLFEKASEAAIKRQKQEQETRVVTALGELPPLIEAFIGKHGTIDPQTQQPIDANKAIEVLLTPFKDYGKLTGDTTKLSEAYKMVNEAKVGAAVAFLTDSKNAPSGLAAIDRQSSGDLGSLSPIYKGLTSEQKKQVQDRVQSHFNATNAAIKAEQERIAEINKAEATKLELELVGPNTTRARQEQIVQQLVAFNAMTPQAAKAWFKESEASQANPFLELRLKQQIDAGLITTLDDLVQYKGNLTKAQIESVGNYMRDAGNRQASKAMDQAAGLIGGFSINPSEDKLKRRMGIEAEYKKLLKTELAPQDAASQAIENFNNSKAEKDKEARRKALEPKIKGLLDQWGVTVNVPYEDIDPSMLKGKNGKPLSKDQVNLLKPELDAWKKNL